MLISDTPFKKTRANVAKQIQIATDCNDIFLILQVKAARFSELLAHTESLPVFNNNNPA